MTGHRCGPPTDTAIALAVDESVMAAPMSLALTWLTAVGVRRVFDRTCRLEDTMRAQGLCLLCGKPLVRQAVPA